jgi:MFS family permease
MGVKTVHLPATGASRSGGSHAGIAPVGAALGASLTRSTALLFSVACGLAVANVYYAQPLLDTIANEFGIPHAAVGIVITVTQIGYGVGLVLVVPLGDLMNRRR